MIKTITKNAHQLRKGDIVLFYGGRFEVVTDLRESSGHRPEGYWPEAGVGPSDCVVCEATCLSGEVRGYFRPGSSWTFQGNHRATFAVVAQ
jgi:hypothetical protein